MIWTFFLLLSSALCSSQPEGVEDAPCAFHSIHMIHFDRVDVGGLFPWTDHLDMVSPRDSECGGSGVHVSLLGSLEEQLILINQRGVGLVGVFGRDSQGGMECVYPALNGVSEDGALPSDGILIPVLENDILIAVLPHVSGWKMDLASAFVSMQEFGLGSAPEAFEAWAIRFGRGLLDEGIPASVIMATIGRKGAISSPYAGEILIGNAYGWSVYPSPFAVNAPNSPPAIPSPPPTPSLETVSSFEDISDLELDGEEEDEDEFADEAQADAADASSTKF